MFARTGEDDANLHKWMAILLDARSGIEGTQTRVRQSGRIKEHMIKSHELNPEDPVVAYMLGKWCYDMSGLTPFQRVLAKVLYAAPPEASYDEAYYYFKKAYGNKRNVHYIPNIYMLGETCFKLNHLYWARYYFNMASLLTPRTERERIYVEKAKVKLATLQSYHINNNTLLNENSCLEEPD